MTHYTCPRCGAQMAPWDLHSDGDEDVCPDCCTNPACNGPSMTDQLVDYLASLRLVPTADGLLDLPPSGVISLDAPLSDTDVKAIKALFKNAYLSTTRSTMDAPS